MKEGIQIMITIIASALLFLAIIWFGLWAFSKLPENVPCEKIQYYNYSVQGIDEDAGSDLELAKELANGRPIYVRGNSCK